VLAADFLSETPGAGVTAWHRLGVVPARRFPHLLHALWFAVLALTLALVAEAALVSFALLGAVLALAVLWPLRA